MTQFPRPLSETNHDEGPWIIVGGGGHAKVLVSTLISNHQTVRGIVDPHLAAGTKILGVDVLGNDDVLSSQSPPFTLAIGVGANPSTQTRRTIFEEMRSKGYPMKPLIAATAVVSPLDVTIESAAQILSLAVVHPSASIGHNVVINTGAIVEHDVRVGEHSFISPAAVLTGGVSIGTGCFIGAGATILPGCTLGNNVVVGANATVCSDVKDEDIVVGTPARALTKDK